MKETGSNAGMMNPYPCEGGNEPVPLEGLSFSEALKAMRSGEMVHRADVEGLLAIVGRADTERIMLKIAGEDWTTMKEFCTEALLANDWMIV